MFKRKKIMAKSKRSGGLMSYVRSMFSMRGLIIMALGAIVVAVIGGPVQSWIQGAADKVKATIKKS